MKQLSGSTCPVTVVLSKQATHAPRLTLQTQALARPKSPQIMWRHFRWSSSPVHADLMFMDLPMTQTSPAEFQSDRRHTETDSTLDPPTWGGFDAKKWPYGCDGFRSCCAVNHFRGGRGTQASKSGWHPSKQGQPAGRQAPKAGRQPPKAGRQPPKAGSIEGREAAKQAEANKCEQKKDTQTPTHPYARTPRNPNGYPHVRQNSWFQNLTFEMTAKN